MTARRLPNLTSLRAFEAAARHLSFTLAADELSVTQGAVSRQVKQLEAYLKVELFERRTRAIELTVTGRAYYESIRSALDAMEQATGRIVGNSRTKVLTLNVLPTFAIRWLIPRLPRFSEQNPDIEIRMLTSIRPIRFDTDIDMALRVGAPVTEGRSGGFVRDGKAHIDLIMAEDYSGIEAELLLPDILVPVCAPQLLGGEPVLSRLERLRDHKLLHMNTRMGAWRDWLAETPLRDDPLPIASGYGHWFMVIEAAIRGRGIACVPKVLVEDELASGRLAIAFPREVESDGGYYMLYRRSQKQNRRLSLLRRWLKAEAALPTHDV